MFEVLKSAKVEQDNDCAGFIALYERFCHDYADPGHDRARMAKFRTMVQKAWQNLDTGQQELVIAAMLHRGILPRVVATALHAFGGRVVSVV